MSAEPDGYIFVIERVAVAILLGAMENDMNFVMPSVNFPNALLHLGSSMCYIQPAIEANSCVQTVAQKR